jgi:glycopeptide antibiotics resistance protein
MFIHRGGFGLIDKEYFIYYIKTINIIPFKTIIGYIKNINNISAFMYNVIGNLIALMPLSIILILIDSKNNNIKRQLIFLICTTFIIEIFQLLFGTGSFDIDDFILNIGGSIIMLIIINKLNIVNKIRSLFYQDFNIKFKYKIIIHIIILIITFILNIITLYEYISAYSYQEEPSTDIIYISERENCDGVDNKNIGEYYISFECLDVIYQSKDNVQINLIDALEQGYISVDDLKQILLDNNFLYDEDNNCFSNTSDSNYVYMYDNKIIFTKESLNN